jgi:hypothetical protein
VCPSCKGTGKIECRSTRGKDFQRACKSCKGTGKLNLDYVRKVIARTKSQLEAISPELFRGTLLSLEAVDVELSPAQ